MWIMIAQSGGLEKYQYANHFFDAVSPHLQPNEEERAALMKNGIGPLGGKAKKTASKISQIFIDRRMFCAHLFYTPSHDYWFLFYFDQRDIGGRSNHWKHGPHVHLISHHWSQLQLQEVWNSILNGKTKFPTKIHLRYVGQKRISGTK